MQIEIPFAHTMVRTWVEYEIVAHTGPDAGATERKPV